jgi:hypothetical protein
LGAGSAPAALVQCGPALIGGLRLFVVERRSSRCGDG